MQVSERWHRRLRSGRQSHLSSLSLFPRSRKKRRAAKNATTDAGTTLLFGMQVTGAGAATATNDQVQAGDHLKRRALKANNLLPMRPSKKAASLSRCSA